MTDDDAGGPGDERRERWQALRDLEGWLERPMMVLGVVWLALLVVELVEGLSPALEWAATAIWIVFIADFALRLALAPDRRAYLASNWLTLVSLLVPALRLFRALRAVRVLRAGRALRSIRLVKVVASINRGMRALGRSMRRRHLGYVVALTAIVIVAGAAGMSAFEGDPSGAGGTLRSYGDALWWTTMIMTTLGSDFWPRSAEGRVLCVLLALYAFAVFGYVTASLATYFIGRDASAPDGELADATTLAELRRELMLLRQEIGAARGGFSEGSGGATHR
jgi:voltage-gated potassium channel